MHIFFHNDVLHIPCKKVFAVYSTRLENLFPDYLNMNNQMLQ